MSLNSKAQILLLTLASSPLASGNTAPKKHANTAVASSVTAYRNSDVGNDAGVKALVAKIDYAGNHAAKQLGHLHLTEGEQSRLEIAGQGLVGGYVSSNRGEQFFEDALETVMAASHKDAYNAPDITTAKQELARDLVLAKGFENAATRITYGHR